MAKIVALVFWLMLLVLAFAQRDFYEILGITRRSTAAQIKKAYRYVYHGIINYIETPTY